MNRNKLKSYAPQARRDFIQAVTDRAAHYGLSAKKIEPMTEQGDVVLIAGKPFPKAVGEKRKKLEARIRKIGFEQTMEAMAYTWFNRLVAIRFMELHGYLEHGYRVLSHPAGHTQPELLEHAEHVELAGLDKQKVIALKLDGTKQEELYRNVLLAQCNALSQAMPFLFERIDDESELLLPGNLLHSDSLIRNLVNEIDEEDWQQVEIIGWLYQFYISERKNEVIGKVVASEDIPAATQLFTPNWIVKYLVQNTLGRQWLATYPQSALRQQMEYYIEPAEQSPEVQEQLKAITPLTLNPEELTLLDPACGSGHILVEAYDLFKAIYQERGYRSKDIPSLILSKNLFGLEIDDRAAQLAAFALMMKAREDDRCIFDGDANPNVLAIRESRGINAADLTHALNAPARAVGEGHVSQADIAVLLELFEDAKTFGSLIQIPPTLAANLEGIGQRLSLVLTSGDLTHASTQVLRPLIRQAKLMARQYDAVVANPPYLGSKGMNSSLKAFAKQAYSDTKYNTFCMFIARLLEMLAPNGRVGMVTLQGWLFQDRYSRFRKRLLDSHTLTSMAHLGPNAFPEISGEVVQAAAFVIAANSTPDFAPTFFALYDGDSEDKAERLRNKHTPITDIHFCEFDSLPDDAFLYWASKKSRDLFRGDQLLGSVVATREGMATADNPRFLRYFWEVAFTSIERNATSDETAQGSGKRWFPYVKGGEFRKWFGNNELVVNWYNNGEDIKGNIDKKTGRVRSHNYNGRYGFKAGFSWSSISSNSIAARHVPEGFMFDAKGPMAFCTTDQLGKVALGLVNSKVGFHFMRLIAPSLDFKLGHVEGIPYIASCAQSEEFSANVEQCIEIARGDWNELETSPDFHSQCLVAAPGTDSISNAWEITRERREKDHQTLRCLEETNNSLLIQLYGLQDELSPEVPDDQITLYRPDREEDILRLLSYAIGCLMGRYSLDKPGLIYALSGNQGFDPSQYTTFRADDDGILPLFDSDWGIRDDATNRFVEFIGVAWPKEHLEDNLKFVADSIGPSNGEQPRDTIRRYLSTGFYKHHLSMYKKRPIYWLFSSGKQRAFQCLVYLHRYNEGTLARMRTEYVIPLLGKLTARIAQLADDISAATSSQQRKRLENEKDTASKQLVELQGFDEKLRHYADQRITLDLDDGVKVNYAKFSDPKYGDILAEVKAICGTKDED